jgi:hypothetical protein
MRDYPKELAEALGREDWETAAAIAERDLGDTDLAAQLWQRLFERDETSVAAHDALERLFAASQRWMELTTILEHRAELAAEPAEVERCYRTLLAIYRDELADDQRAAETEQRLRDLTGG